MSSRLHSWPWLELGGGTEIKENNIPRKKTFSFNRGGSTSLTSKSKEHIDSSDSHSTHSTNSP
ncbi:hypothetical protein M6B38_229410 [Iris pallida]|uniref:Uncharacterized protein n=1 Tax=Iris pallida TaxID=29817 RepID=A0AAX6DTR1_IRIPA|nr:hypothetical protein M6B38_229410 [Iris pallida]